VIGGFAFNITMHHFVYKRLAEEFPKLLFRCLTDDKTDFGKPTTYSEWQNLYKYLADSLRAYDRCGNPIGIYRHNLKGRLILPPGAPDPEPWTGILDLTEVTRDAARVAGGHVGPKDTVLELGMKTGRKAMTKIHAIGRFGETNPQAALKLLAHASRHTLEYYYSITPPDIASVIAAMVQDCITRTIDKILSPRTYDAPSMHRERYDRAHTMMQLTPRLGGGNVLNQPRVAICAFLATTYAVLLDPLVSTLTEFISEDVDKGYKAYYNLFGDRNHEEVTDLIKGFPPDTRSLFEACSNSLQHSTTKRMKMQTRLTSASMVHERDKLRDLVDSAKHDPTEGTTKTDMAHVALSLRRSQQSRIVNAQLCHQRNRIQADDFVFHWRYYLNLPRLIRRGRPTMVISGDRGGDLVHVQGVNVGHVVEVCALNHGEACTLGPNGAHEISCVSTYSARYRAHNMFTRIVSEMAREVNAVTRIEPKTKEVLLDQYTESEVRGLVPKVVTKASKIRMNELASVFLSLSNTPHDDPRTLALLQKVRDTLSALPEDTKGVRLDLEIVLPDMRVFLCDFTGIHPTSVTALKQIDGFLRANVLANDAASGVVVNNPLARAPSPAVVHATRLKQLRYDMLLVLIKRQLEAHMRDVMPKLVPGVITHLGELGPDFIVLIETLTAEAGRQFRPTAPAAMGMTKAKFTAMYRTRFKDALLCANASGFGRALLAAGNPMAGWALAPGDEDDDLPDWDLYPS
jgi:hypothetical protein